MVQSNKRWGIAALGMLTAAAAIPLFGQKPSFSDMDNNEAREIAQMIEQGQIGLSEAIRLAETKSNGKAMECFAHLQFGSPEMGFPTNVEKGALDRPGQPGTQPGDPNRPSPTAKVLDKDAKRVVYHVRIFADGSLTPYMVDAKTKEVIAIGDRFKQTTDRPTLDRDKDHDRD